MNLVEYKLLLDGMRPSFWELWMPVVGAVLGGGFTVVAAYFAAKLAMKNANNLKTIELKEKYFSEYIDALYSLDKSTIGYNRLWKQEQKDIIMNTMLLSTSLMQRLLFILDDAFFREIKQKHTDIIMRVSNRIKNIDLENSDENYPDLIEHMARNLKRDLNKDRTRQH